MGYSNVDIQDALTACYPGCNLYFPPGTFDNVAIDIGSFPDGFAMYGAGIGQTILRAPLYNPDPPTPSYDPIIQLLNTAPNGVVIQDMTLDGRRRDQVAPTDLGFRCLDNRPASPPAATPNSITSCDEASKINGKCWAYFVGQAHGIYTGNPDGIIHHDGLIQRVEVKEILGSAGIALREAHDWTVQDNVLYNLGCHDDAASAFDGFDADCPNLVPNLTGTPYVPYDCYQDGVTNRRTNAFGIEVGFHSLNVLLENNEIGTHAGAGHGSTKHAIQTYTSGSVGCDDPDEPYSPTDITISGNSIAKSGNGVVVNSGCRVVIEDNTVESSQVPGYENGIGAHGFLCAAGGDESEWRGNTAQGNQGSGFLVGGACGDDLYFQENTSVDNCRHYDVQLGQSLNLGDYHFDLTGSDLTVLNADSNSPKCYAGMQIINTTGAFVDGGTVYGGRLYGIRLNNAHVVEIENLSIQKGAGVGTNGIRFESNVSDTYVQATTTVQGFGTPVDPISELCDGDDTHYCGQLGQGVPTCSPRVNPDPECCDNIGSGNDQDCAI